MNLMVKHILLVLQVYAIATSVVLQGSSASSHFEPVSGPEGNIHLGPSTSPNTPHNEPLPDVAAPIISIPEGSPPSPPVIQPPIPVSVPPIPQPDKGPTTQSPVNPPTMPVQIAPPPKEVHPNPPPVVEVAPSMSQVPPSIPQAPPFILPEPVASPPTKMPVASPPTYPTSPVTTPILPLPAEIPPSTLPNSPPAPPTTHLSPSNLPDPMAMPPSTLPINSPPSPPTVTVPPPSLPDPVAPPPSTLPRSPPPSPPTLAIPPPNLPAPVASPPSTVPRDSPPSPPTLNMPPPKLPVPVASPPHPSQTNVPPPNPTFAEPPSILPAPVALPPTNSPKNLQPINHNSSMPPPNLPEPHISPISTPVPSKNKGRDGSPVPSPPNQTTNIAPSQHSRVKAPSLQDAPNSYEHAPPPPYSSYKSPPTKSHPPPPSLPPLYPPPPPGPKRKTMHEPPPPPSGPKDNNTRHPDSPPPTPSEPGLTVPPADNSVSPSISPPTKSPDLTVPPSGNSVSPSISPPTKSPGLRVPSAGNSVSPSISPPTKSPSIQTTMPVLSPKVSPSQSSPKIPRPLQALPPPPPNEDCSITCVEPLTNTPPGTPCKCVLPMQVELGLGVALYTFFPLVSELASEMAAGLFMRSSQVRIMGANEDNQDPENTIVIINLVPLGEVFDNVTAFLTAQRLWLKQVPIKSSLFGDYEVLYVKYPGLPPSPPMPSSSNGANGVPYGHGNNGRDIKPLGVDVSKQRHSNKLSGGVISIIALTAVVAVVLVCVAVWALLVKRKDMAQTGPTQPATLTSATKSSGVGASITGSGPESASLSFRSNIAYNGSAKTFSLSDMEKATDNFNEAGVLGEGGFGRVYSGVLEDGTKVAVKVLKRDDQQGGREFLAEVEMLSRLHHRNLVRLIGICTEERCRCLVYELIPNGSVESHLHGINKETTPLDWGARLKIALGAARGLAYLHEDSSPRVIHRDFKSSNILLEHDYTPKVSDFGLARSALDEENQHISTRVMGTFGYVAPEYAMTGHLLVKSDVYSYGVVLLELLTGRKPIDMSMPSGQENLVAWARPLLPTPEGLNLLIDPSLSPEVPFDSIAKVAAIASMCVQPEVSHRPFMGEVVQALKLVCNECEETQDLGSRSCSQEDLTSMDFDPRSSTNSGPGPDLGPSRSTYESYESPLDVENGFLGQGLDVDSYRMSSSSGPLRPRRRLQIWERVKRFSSGNMSDYGDFLRLLSRSR